MLETVLHIVGWVLLVFHALTLIWLPIWACDKDPVEVFLGTLECIATIAVLWDYLR